MSWECKDLKELMWNEKNVKIEKGDMKAELKRERARERESEEFMRNVSNKFNCLRVYLSQERKRRSESELE